MNILWKKFKSTDKLDLEPNYVGIFQSTSHKKVTGGLSMFMPIDSANIPTEDCQFMTEILVHYSKKCPVKANWKEKMPIECHFLAATSGLYLKIPKKDIKYTVNHTGDWTQIEGTYDVSFPPDHGTFYLVHKTINDNLTND